MTLYQSALERMIADDAKGFMTLNRGPLGKAIAVKDYTRHQKPIRQRRLSKGRT